MRNKLKTHVQATHVDFDVLLVDVLFVESDLLQQVEVGPRVLQAAGTGGDYVHVFVTTLTCACVCCEAGCTLMSSLKLLMVAVPAFWRW